MNIDKLVRSKRKTLALQITSGAELVVRAPFRVSDSFIQTFVRKHTDWILQKKKEMSLRAPAKKRFVSNDVFLYLGEEYVLRREPYQGRSLVQRGGMFFLDESIEDPRKEFERWYKKQAHKVIVPRVQVLARKYGFIYNTIRITSAKTRWGSCSGKKNLSFSWKLVMAQEEVIDYVILHELAHLKNMNHSQKFWKSVEEMCPAYKQHKKWLKERSSGDMFLG